MLCVCTTAINLLYIPSQSIVLCYVTSCAVVCNRANRDHQKIVLYNCMVAHLFATTNGFRAVHT